MIVELKVHLVLRCARFVLLPTDYGAGYDRAVEI